MLSINKRDFAPSLSLQLKRIPSFYFSSRSRSFIQPVLLCIGRVFTSLYLLVFINGILLASILYCMMEADYDKQIFSAIVQTIKTDKITTTNQDSFILRSMSMANSLQQSRQKVFEGREISDIKGCFLRNSIDDLLTGRGACGSASIILLRVLELDGYKVRLAQMKVNGVYGGHITVEAKKNKGWILLDPQFNCCFKKANGDFASFADVQHNWKYYKTQIPPGYPQTYAYEDVRYTNWAKVPCAGPLIKNLLQIIIGKRKVEEICIRPYLIKNYQILFYFFQIVFVPVLLATIHRFYKKQKNKFKKLQYGYSSKAEENKVVSIANFPEYYSSGRIY